MDLCAKSLKEFQFQCYGERLLCKFPWEYCSSSIRKCVECSVKMCQDVGNIPLSCDYFCCGVTTTKLSPTTLANTTAPAPIADCNEQTSWFIPFVIVTTMLAVLLLALLFHKVIFRKVTQCVKYVKLVIIIYYVLNSR
ncbi:hypothetical protein ACF0H5_000221 [Mactra antiquata]